MGLGLGLLEERAGVDLEFMRLGLEREEGEDPNADGAGDVEGGHWIALETADTDPMEVREVVARPCGVCGDLLM